jgi:hypothetical protein
MPPDSPCDAAWVARCRPRFGTARLGSRYSRAARPPDARRTRARLATPALEAA